MSSRERWIIYPLLFFAFCLAAKDQHPLLHSSTLKADRVECQELSAHLVHGGQLKAQRLTVATNDGRRQAQIGSSGGGEDLLTIFGPNDRVAVILAATNECGVIQIENYDGSMTQLRAVEDGGRLAVVDKRGEAVAVQRLPLSLFDLRGWKELLRSARFKIEPAPPLPPAQPR